uniref:CHRD domain-containing protein n=1 Tax=Thermus islandicus TaxID=540988 RepID=A0A7C2C3P6_9DEIN
MKRVAVLGLMAVLVVWGALGQMARPTEVYHAALSGQGLRGTAVVLVLPAGLEVFVYLEGLKPGSGAYANHIHFNRAGNANCREQNGDQILGLTSLVADANGRAVAFTRLPGARLPEGSTYVNVHANTPAPVGGSIACGDLSEVKERY